MSLLVDTSVWSLALRRDHADVAATAPEVAYLREALAGNQLVCTTGVVLQEILQGAVRPRTRQRIVTLFSGLRLLTPAREDHVAAADLRNHLRAHGVQLGTIDALIAQLAIAHVHVLLSTDRDFQLAAEHVELRLWRAG